MLRMLLHHKCRQGLYPFSRIARFEMPDEKVPWSSSYESYNPPLHNSDALKGKPWADPDLSDPGFRPAWNQLDGSVVRTSFMGCYQTVDNWPLNPIGRTGIRGRGVLGRCGPNHAADPIVTRWKRLPDGTKESDRNSSKPILEVCLIQRRDCGEWALPGGMVDPGENVSATLKREFMEEAMNSLQSSKSELEANQQMVEDFFANGTEIYKGYVDDPRNTDNAWMETVAMLFHDSTGNAVGRFQLHSGDDAKNVQWTTVDHRLKLYASHAGFVEKAAESLSAHW